MLLCTTSLRAKPEAPTDVVGKYYIEKNATVVAAIWEGMVSEGTLRGDPQTREMLIGFLGAALREHPEVICSRLRSLHDFGETERDALTIIIWLSQTDCSRRLLVSAGLVDVAETKVPPIEARGITSTIDPSFLIGWFYATGDTNALAPMINEIITADWSNENERAEACGGALWVLCEEDERARAAVEEALKTSGLSDDARKVFLFALGRIKSDEAQ